MRFRDFVSPNGKNVIHDWLHGKKGRRVRADINTFLIQLSTYDIIPDQFISSVRSYPGLVELKLYFNRTQYRPLGIYQPGQVILLLAIAIERGDEWEPPNVCRTAMDRRREFERDTEGRSSDHNFD